MMKYLMSNECTFPLKLWKELIPHLSQRPVKQKLLYPGPFCIGVHFEIKFAPVGGGHTVFDYDDSQKNVMTD